MTNIYESLDNNYIKFGSQYISTIIDNDNKLWVNANETASIIGYLDAKKAIQRHVDEDDKIKLEEINTSNMIDKHPHTIYINEGGLYSIILASRLPRALKFKKWITNEVLPSIRKYGYYKQKKNYENELDELMKKINFLTKENNNMKNELKFDLFPSGGIVYAVDYSEDDKEFYRIGKTGDMKTRKNIYNTHTLYKKKVTHAFETDCPIQLETCVRLMLYKFRVKNRKDFYECSNEDVKKAFENCKKSFECMKNKKDLSFDKVINSLQARTKPLKEKIKDLKNKAK